MNILLTGSSGFVASNIIPKLSDHNLTLICRDDFDLCDPKVANNFFKDKYFDVVIHTAIIGGSRLVEDSKEVVADNSLMALNLLNNKKHWGRLIHFGSGAELDRSSNIDETTNNFYLLVPKDPYGLSKNIICRLFDNYDNIYNLRIFNVFAKNELDRRMIISGIRNYIDNKPIVIHQDKYMDFFYMEDLLSILNLYLKGETLPKEIDCVYKDKIKLSDIANMINNLEDKKVPIIIENKEEGKSYCGRFNPITNALGLIGMEKGILEVYENLKK